MKALSVVKKYAETQSFGLSWRFSPKSSSGGLKGGPMILGTCPSNLVVVSTSDPCTKYEEDWTKIVVAIVDERFMQTDKHTDRHTDIHSSDFISVQCHELHWTDNNAKTILTMHPHSGVFGLQFFM